MPTQTVELEGHQYVVIKRAEYDRLKTLAKSDELPPLPEANERGNYPAVEYSRASIARSIIRDRAELGLNQRELADLAGVRVETLCRIETGKHTPSVPTIEKIDRALQAQRKRDRRATRSGRSGPNAGRRRVSGHARTGGGKSA